MHHHDTKNAANFLKISRRTLERWRMTGEGPVYRKLGGRVVYAECDLIAFSDNARRVNTSQVQAGGGQ